MSLDTALSILTAEICVQIAPSMALLCKTVAPSNSNQTDLCTWQCKDAHLFTLFKVNPLLTLVYSHTNEVLYYASLQAQLSASCPLHTGFLCQFTLDTLPEGKVPRLLVFDVIPASPMPAAARADFLRAVAPNLPQPLCCVQWIGSRTYLTKEFIHHLPHAIQGLYSLADDPLCFCKMDLV